jgi:hypothetical protein
MRGQAVSRAACPVHLGWDGPHPLRVGEDKAQDLPPTVTADAVGPLGIPCPAPDLDDLGRDPVEQQVTDRPHPSWRPWSIVRRGFVLGDRALGILVHAQLEHVGARVVAGNVEVVLAPRDVVEVQLRVQDLLFIETRPGQHRTEGTDDRSASAQ